MNTNNVSITWPLPGDCTCEHCPHCGGRVPQRTAPYQPYVPFYTWPGYPQPYVGDWPFYGQVTFSNGSPDLPAQTVNNVPSLFGAAIQVSS